MHSYCNVELGGEKWSVALPKLVLCSVCVCCTGWSVSNMCVCVCVCGWLAYEPTEHTFLFMNGLIRIVIFRQHQKQCFSLHKDTTPPQPNHTVTSTHIEPEQYNTWNKSTVFRKLLKMDVLTFETCWAVNSEIIKQVTSNWSIFIQLPKWCTVQ